MSRISDKASTVMFTAGMFSLCGCLFKIISEGPIGRSRYGDEEEIKFGEYAIKGAILGALIAIVPITLYD